MGSLLASLFGMAHFGPSQGVGDSNHWITQRVGTQTHAGSMVNEHNALELPVVYSAIGIIADGVAQLPVSIVRKSTENVDGKVMEKREPLHDHPLDMVLNLRANKYMSAFTFQNTYMGHVLGWGNGYAEIQHNGAGDVVGLWPLLPDRTWPVCASNGEVRFETQIDGKIISLPHDKVLHIPAMGFDGLIGYSQLYMARQAIGLGKSLEEHGGKFFANEARSGGFIEHPGKLGDRAKKNLADSVQEQGGLENAQRIKVLEEGAKFHAITIPPDDAQFLETRQFQLEEIARMYRVPPHMLQSQAKVTSWGTGITQMSLGFVRYTLSPWLVRAEQEFTYKLLGEAERDIYLKHNVAGLLRGDAAARGAYYTQALSPTSGWMKKNEVRALEDLDPDEEEESPEPPMAMPPQFPPAAPADDEEEDDNEAE